MLRVILVLFVIVFTHSFPHPQWNPLYLSRGWDPTANIFPRAPTWSNRPSWGNQQNRPGQGGFNLPFFNYGSQSSWIPKWIQGQSSAKPITSNTNTGGNVQSVMSKVQSIVQNAEELIHCIEINNTSPECKKRQEEEQRRRFPFGPPHAGPQRPGSPHPPGAQQPPPNPSASPQPQEVHPGLSPSQQPGSQSSQILGGHQQPPAPEPVQGQPGFNPSAEAQHPPLESSNPLQEQQQPPDAFRSPEAEQHQPAPNPSPEVQQPPSQAP